MADMDLRAAADLLCRKALELADLAGGVQYCLAQGDEGDILIESMLERVESIARLADQFKPVVRSQNG